MTAALIYNRNKEYKRAIFKIQPLKFLCAHKIVENLDSNIVQSKTPELLYANFDQTIRILSISLSMKVYLKEMYLKKTELYREETAWMQDAHLWSNSKFFNTDWDSDTYY